MFQSILSAIKETLSGAAAKEHVAEIARYHRIQASPGFRQAAAYCHAALAAEGIQVETLSFAGDGKTFYWADLMPPEWESTDAELWLIGPEKARRKLADFRECKIALIQRSDPTPPEGVEAEVVALDDGTEDEHYQGLDVSGKMVLTNNSDFRRIRELAVDKYGAIGLLYDGMMESPPVRARLDVPDARQYVSFWPTGEEKQPCFGFSLSPRLGDDLRKLLKKPEPGQPVRVWARVDTRFVPDGHIEVVSALIPGQTDEEVLVVAHLCHPQASANDNASGAGAVLEIARTLQRLIAQGELPAPRRGLRFLLLPEMTGTYAYLATRPERIAKMVAAINLDMVGQNQELCGSSFLIERLPRALPNFADDLIARLREELTQESQSHAGQGGFALFRHAITPFSGGSDHYILSDPSVGVPCPMIIQWPDKFYHTSLDTLEKVDPASLHRAGVLAATYAYFVANAAAAQATWLGLEMLARIKGRFAATVQGIVTEAMSKNTGEELAQAIANLTRRVAYDLSRETLALASLRRLSPALDVTPWQEEAAAFAQAESARGQAAIRAYAASLGLDLTPGPFPAREGEKARDEWEEKAASLVPVRCYPGPVNLLGFMSRLSVEEREAWRVYSKAHRQENRHLPTVALYWADGQRTLLDIVEAVEMETGQRAVEFLVKYFQLLGKLGLAEWR
jgi:aminopeptidase YwaD